ncbi:PAQR family membrane homeostasis protein TrhA [Aliikangiella sp. IMCC44359]|uniref:PAQR family membrane homeostasis protein TrhA n=1 Tax=Aliikangiella sp. IMCC44359 TaxID=3459125 RepID=UPI00403AAA88
MKTELLSGYSLSEEILNVITHALGLAIAVVGLVHLIIRANNPLEIASVSIYGGTLVLMFFASTIYHAIQHEKSKKRLKLLDHAAIYLLIAGTYTPFLLISLSGTLSTVSIIFIWLLAFAGVGFKLFSANRFPRISMSTYLIMGWLIVALIYPLYQVLPVGGLWLLFAGGAFFSIGTLFYNAKHKAYTHAIWHLFVIGGCSCHFFSVYLYVV